MYATCLQQNSCDAGPGHIKIVLGLAFHFFKFESDIAEASSSYSLQTEFKDGSHLVHPNCTSFENNLT